MRNDYSKQIKELAETTKLTKIKDSGKRSKHGQILSMLKTVTLHLQQTTEPTH